MTMPAMIKTVDDVVDAACKLVRGDYARQVICGQRRWSGSDLASGARKWGSYIEQRRKARNAVESVGGCVIACDDGTLETALMIGMDDYGNAIYDIGNGFRVVTHTGKRCRSV
jgi:hypothetical protein